MPRIINHIERKTMARITGALYIGFIFTSVLADVLGHIGIGEPEQVFQTIVTAPRSFRWVLWSQLFRRSSFS